jgi:hypothetical protein
VSDVINYAEDDGLLLVSLAHGLLIPLSEQLQQRRNGYSPPQQKNR